MSIPAEVDELFHADGPVEVTHRGPGSIVLRCTRSNEPGQPGSVYR